MRKRKRKRFAGSSGLAAFTGGIATNKITTFWWKRKRGSVRGESVSRIYRFHIPDFEILEKAIAQKKEKEEWKQTKIRRKKEKKSKQDFSIFFSFNLVTGGSDG